MTKAADDVIAERERQKTVEGWSESHDDSHTHGELALAASAYAEHAAKGGLYGEDRWPWGKRLWKPRDCRSDLVRAGALILAEIERLDRAAARKEP